MPKLSYLIPKAKRFAFSVYALLFAGTLLSVPPVIADTAAKVQAPDFLVHALSDRSDIKLSDYAGQIVLVNFWASWCYPCLVEMPEFQKIYDRFKDKGFTVLAVAVFDKFEDAKKFQDEQDFSFPIAFDTDEKAKDAFGVEVVPMTYLVGRDGNLILIPDPKTKQAKLRVNDPTIWVQQETFEFLQALTDL